MRPTLPPRSLTVAAAVAAALVTAANPLADALGLKYWASGWGPRKLHALQASELAPEVLVLGSSRMDAALVARHLERRLEAGLGRPVVVYNAAQAATGASEPAWILRDLVASNGCPAVVVLDVHVEGLNAGSERLRRSLEVYTSLADLPGALPEVGLDPELLDALLGSPFRGFANLARRLALPPDSPREAKLARAFLARHGSKYGLWAPRPASEAAKSLATRSRQEIEREARGRRAFLVAKHHLDRFVLGGLPVANLERLADRAARCGAALLLVELPTRYRMAEWGFAPVEEAPRRYLEEFARRRGAVHLDLARALEPLADADFFDLSHLSFQGAIKASDAVVPALVEALKARPSAGVSLPAPGAAARADRLPHRAPPSARDPPRQARLRRRHGR